MFTPRAAAAGLIVLTAAFTLASAQTYRPPQKELGFPVYTNSISPGRQLAGQHKPASTPALSPADAQKKFTLPPGFEIRLFASEPEVVNPVAMTWDERGRLWVVELYEYPLGVKPGEKPRDRIKILEDLDGDGTADKVSVFADGFTLATGLLLGNGGVYLGQAPHLLFLKDTNGDDKADTQEIVKTGFGLEDRHELLNGFTWGPDGYLYMTHGVFTHSKVLEPGGVNSDAVTLTAGVARLHPQNKKFEVFAEGTSNPWGVDFDVTGNAFVSACVIEHLFHLVPGGIYDRQAGQPPFPYAYELLHAINDHKHHMAAYSGIQVYHGNQFPGENSNTIFQGNIHDNAVHQDRLTPRGSSFIASHWRDLARANDGWFMPVSMQVGPDGAVWIMDWYDKYPCYQNANADPAGVDREHGRIWRVVHVGNQPAKPVPSRPDRDMNLAKMSPAQLTQLLAHPNSWQRRTAQRLLTERGSSPSSNASFPDAALRDLLRAGPSQESRLAALWTLHSCGRLDESGLDQLADEKVPALRAWTARLTGERGQSLPSAISRLEKLASDPDPTVRLAVAVAARQFISSALTLNAPPQTPVSDSVTGSILSKLVESSSDAKDPVLPYMIWMAAEPIVALDPVAALSFYQSEGAAERMPLAGLLLTKIMRRICDLRDDARLSAAVIAFGRIPADATAALTAGLRGLIEGQRGKAVVPNAEAVAVISKLAGLANAEISQLARQLGALWGDATALKATLTEALNKSATDQTRISAIQIVRKTKSDSTRDAMLQLLRGDEKDAIRIEAIAALGEIGGDLVGQVILEHWPKFGITSRRAASEALNSRSQWRSSLFGGLEKGIISASEMSPSLVRSLVNHNDEAVRDRARRFIGRYREMGADKLTLIAAKRNIALEGGPNLENGRAVAQRTCLICHKLHGEGAEVGPDLTGVGRSSLDTLLANIIDPNQIIGAGYENVEIETKDDRSVSGRMMENTDARVRLLLSGPKEEIIAKSEIKSLRISENSVMPEGLEQLPDGEFRDMIWYLLAPPQEGPLTETKRKALSGL